MGMTIAFDPGKMTGIAMLNECDEFTSFALPYAATDDKEAAMVWAERWIASLLVDRIVCESIIISSQTHKKSQDVLASVEQIGILRHLCTAYSVPFKLQTPAEAKSFSTDHKLKSMGWWFVGLDHPRDAARHLMLFKATNDSRFLQELAAKSLGNDG